MREKMELESRSLSTTTINLIAHASQRKLLRSMFYLVVDRLDKLPDSLSTAMGRLRLPVALTALV